VFVLFSNVLWQSDYHLLKPSHFIYTLNCILSDMTLIKKLTTT